MGNKNQLILDIAGVLLTNITPSFWEEISVTSGNPYEDVRNRFKQEIRDDLWNGKLDESKFWEWLNNILEKDSGKYNQELIRKHLKPLPAFSLLKNWSTYFDIHLMSNHRSEWIMPIINQNGEHIRSVTISSDVGCSKPNKEIYKIVESRIDNIDKTKIIFIDDQEKNLIPAREMGWMTIRADSDNKWIEQVNNMIKDIRK